MNILFYLGSIGVSCLGGLVAGALGMAVMVFISAGTPSAAADRAKLLEILKEAGVPDGTALAILEKGLGPWANWRAKLRPFLWRLKSDWPEYGATLEAEFEAAYSRSIPDPAPSFEPSGPPQELVQEQLENGRPDSLEASQLQSYQSEMVPAEPSES